LKVDTKLGNNLVWFRRDLRSCDHAALSAALKFASEHGKVTYCAFVFDKAILDVLPPEDKRLSFIYQSVLLLREKLRALGGDLLVLYGDAKQEIVDLAKRLNVGAVFVNQDYEPDAVKRDAYVAEQLRSIGCDFFTYKDQVIFECDEVLTKMATPYSVFTPYKRACLVKLMAEDGERFYRSHQVQKYVAALAPILNESFVGELVTLEQMGFVENPEYCEMAGEESAGQLLQAFLERISNYANARDFPILKATSHLSVHLRFGTISIRALVREAQRLIALGDAQQGVSTWLSELIWRDFYFMILAYHPHVVNASFKPDYDAVEWESGERARELFLAWCEARTGYPLVDAAMLQLNQTGFMHNRLRMVTASFLVKDLGVDWRWGERYFAEKLLDYDLSANNGGWQWSASTGCDAQPYFRIFNPITQSEKFDAQGDFIRRYLPQLAHLNAKQIHAPWRLTPIELQAGGMVLGRDYPYPIVEHERAREKTLARYACVKKMKE
jgi:deoxyribodipyrimidine photo-lyase